MQGVHHTLYFWQTLAMRQMSHLSLLAHRYATNHTETVRAMKAVRIETQYKCFIK